MESICDKVKNAFDSMKDKFHDLLKNKCNKKQSIGIISAPCNKGEPTKGTEQGPSVIKETGFIKKLEDNNFSVEEMGEVPMQVTPPLDIGPDDMKNFKQVMVYNQCLSKKVKEVLERTDLCITLGGDHSLPIGCVTGLADLNRNHQVKLIYVDAHPDVATGSSSITKNMNDSMISYLTDLETNRFIDWPSPSLKYSDIVWIGLRDMEPFEIEFLESTPDLLFFNASDVKTRGILEIMKCCLEKLNPGPESPLYVSFDIDALDKSVAPSSAAAEVGDGLTLEEGKMIVQSAFCTGYLRGLDIAGVNPKLGDESDVEKTAMAAYDLIISITEKNIPQCEA